jgi:hypothetical protein
LPSGRSLFGLAQWADRVYLLGGLEANNHAIDDVRVAHIDQSTGVVSAFTATTPLPTARYALAAVADQGFVYILGGADQTGYLNEVWVARVLSDGTLGAWSRTTDMSTPRAFFPAVVTADHGVLVSGGQPGLLKDLQRGELTAPGPAAQMAIKTTAQTVNQGACSGGVTVELRDQNGTPVPADADLNATIALSPAMAYSDSTCNTVLGYPLATLTFKGGRSTSTFFFRSNGDGQLRIDVSATGLASTSQTESVLPTASQPDGGTDTPAATDPHSVNGYGCSSAPAALWAAPVLLWALWLRRKKG